MSGFRTIIIATIALVGVSLDSFAESSCQVDHVIEREVGEHLAESRSHRRGTQCVSGKRATNPSNIDQIGLRVVGDSVRHFLCQPVGTGGDSPTDALPDYQDVGSQAPGGGATTRTSGDGVGLVDQEQRPVLVAKLARGIPEPVFG